jgi:TPR repeat protein
MLGLIVARGEVREPDYEEAHKWFGLSADAGNEAGAANLKYAETLMTPEQVAEGRRRKLEWLDAFRSR